MEGLEEVIAGEEEAEPESPEEPLEPQVLAAVPGQTPRPDQEEAEHPAARIARLIMLSLPVPNTARFI